MIRLLFEEIFFNITLIPNLLVNILVLGLVWWIAYEISYKATGAFYDKTQTYNRQIGRVIHWSLRGVILFVSVVLVRFIT